VSTYLSPIKGKTAIQIFRQFPHLKQKPYWGNHFWATGMLTQRGLDEEHIRKYVKYQEKEEKRQ